MNAQRMLAGDDPETQVLGAMLQSEKAVDDVLDILEPNGDQAFTNRPRRAVYRAIRHLRRAGESADTITVGHLLDKHQEVEAMRLLGPLLAETFAVSRAIEHAHVVRDRHLLRQIAAETAKQRDGNAQHVLDSLLGDLLALQQRSGSGSEVMSFFHLAEQLEQRVASPLAEAGLSAPIPSFPLLMPDRLYVLAGYTADGKTALASQFAIHVSRHGKRVGFTSVEMSREQLFNRAVSAYGVPLDQVETGRITSPKRRDYEKAIKELAPLPIDVIDDASATAATVARHQRIKRYDLLIIDHLHQIMLPGKPSERRQMLEDEVQAFVTLARTEHVPVLLLAQLSRPQMYSGWKQPTLTQLRETARIEQQAAVVAFIWRARDANGEETGDCGLTIAKNRFGRGKTIQLNWNGDALRFTEIAQGREGE